MLRTQRKPTDKNEKMILNNYLTMEKISKWKDQDMSKELLLAGRIHVDFTNHPKSSPKYYRAFLHTETDANDLNYFIWHQLDCMLAAYDSLNEYIERKTKENKALNSILGRDAPFNHRQRLVL